MITSKMLRSEKSKHGANDNNNVIQKRNIFIDRAGDKKEKTKKNTKIDIKLQKKIKITKKLQNISYFLSIFSLFPLFNILEALNQQIRKKE